MKCFISLLVKARGLFITSFLLDSSLMTTSDTLTGSRYKIKNHVIEEISFGLCGKTNAVIHWAEWTGLWINTVFHSVTNKPNATLHEINA